MDLKKMLLDSVPWVFSGIGVFIISLFLKGKYKKKKQKQKVTEKSIGYQAGNDIYIGGNDGHSKPKDK